MNIEIKKLSPELIEDYLGFFDHVAFTDNKEWSECYCVFYHWNNQLEKQRKEHIAGGGCSFNRDLAIQLIQNGTLQGYLAYMDDDVVGWCNANDKEIFDRLNIDKRPELWTDDTNEKIKSVVCYTIAPNMRRKGIATQLLNRVCEDAVAQGYTCVEAYPMKTANVQRNYHGPHSLYERCGFSLHKDLENESIVRKYI